MDNETPTQYVKLAQLENGELWFLIQRGNQWKPYKQIKQLIEGADLIVKHEVVS